MATPRPFVGSEASEGLKGNRRVNVRIRLRSEPTARPLGFEEPVGRSARRDYLTGSPGIMLWQNHCDTLTECQRKWWNNTNVTVSLNASDNPGDPEAEASFRALASLLADSRKAAKPAGLADSEAAAVPLNEPAQRRQSRQLRGAQSALRKLRLG